jgi:chromosome transmission fidelity protein 1
LHTVEAFLLALASPSDGESLPFVLEYPNDTLSDGRIILTAEVSKDRVEIKYQQLNPASHFRELVEASRCVILAGGTMSPVNTRCLSPCSLTLMHRHCRSPP